MCKSLRFPPGHSYNTQSCRLQRSKRQRVPEPGLKQHILKRRRCTDSIIHLSPFVLPFVLLIGYGAMGHISSEHVNENETPFAIN